MFVSDAPDALGIAVGAERECYAVLCKQLCKGIPVIGLRKAIEHQLTDQQFFSIVFPQTVWVDFPRLDIAEGQVVTLLYFATNCLVASALIAVGDYRTVIGNAIENEMAMRMLLVVG